MMNFSHFSMLEKERYFLIFCHYSQFWILLLWFRDFHLSQRDLGFRRNFPQTTCRTFSGQVTVYSDRVPEYANGALKKNNEDSLPRNSGHKFRV
jgi:hypothetical protein